MKKTCKQIVTVILIIVGMLNNSFSIYASNNKETTAPESLHALSAVLMDGISGRVLYGKNAEEPRAMASTTKIMTCILILEQCNLEETAATSAYAASMPKVHLGAAEGEEFYVKDLLYSLMLESHNDSAVILAEHAGGDVPGFAEKMNEKAREIGCEDTWFITPNGLDAQEEVQGEVEKHHTTATDLGRIMRYCISQSPKKEEFLEITRTPSYSFQDVSGKRSFSCNNHNAFLSMMEGALSGKTGFTSEAGYCYIGALEQDGKTLIVALLGCGWPNHKNYKWQDTRALMEYGLEHYTLHSFSEAKLPQIPAVIPVEKGQGEKLGEMAQVSTVRRETEDMKLLLGAEDEVRTVYRGKTFLEAPVKEGDKIGEISYELNGEIWKTEDVVAGNDVEKIDYAWCLKQTIERLK